MLYKKQEQFSSCFWADSAVYLLQKTTKKKTHSNSTTARVHTWHHMSGDESWLVGNLLWLTAQWTGRDLLCGFLLIKGPCCFVPTEGINCSGTTYKRFSTACFTFLFFHLWLYLQGRNLSLREQSSGNLELTECAFFLLLFWGPGFWCEVFLAGETTRKHGNLCLIN